MDINFDAINHKMDDIRTEFAQFIDDDKYTEAENVINAIMMVLDANADIGINSSVNAPDNSFHELYLLLKNEIDRRESAKAGNAAFDGLKHLFENVTRELFQTAEVRRELIQKDPEMDEYKHALEEGQKEARKRKEDLEKEKSKYEFIDKELFFDQSVSPAKDRREIIEQESKYVAQLKEIEESLQKISDWQAEIVANPTDTALISRNNSNIASVQSLLKQKIANLATQGLDISSFGTNIDNFVDAANAGTSKTTAETLRQSRENELRSQYAKIKQKIQDAKNGLITYTDADGNVLNIADEEVIRTAPDINLSTSTGLDEMKQLVGKISAVSRRIDKQIDVCDQKDRIFTDHIRILGIEQDLLNRDEAGVFNDRQTYIDNFDAETIRKVNSEKTERHEDAKKKFLGSREGARQYKECWKRFKSNLSKGAGTGTITIPGAPPRNVNYAYDILGNYPEKGTDLDFMQIESWELRNKRNAQVRAILKEEEEGRLSHENAMEIIATQIYNDGHYMEIVKEMRKIQNVTYSGARSNADLLAKQEELKEEQMRLLMQHERDEDYVKNYNSSHFDVKDTVALALTGGSAMRSRTNQSKKNLTFKDAVGAFFKWTPYNVKNDGTRQIIRTTIANIGGIVSIPFRTLEVAIGAGVAGVTAIAGKITGTYDMPTPYNVGYLHRKEARQEYYLRNGSSRIGAWFKSFFNLNVKDKDGNKVKINDQIVAERCELIDQSIEDKYIRGARQKALEDVAKAKRNREARKAAYRNKAKSAEVYEDIYINDSEAINANSSEKRRMEQRIMQNAILGMEPTYSGKEESYVTGGKKRHGKFYAIDSGEQVDPLAVDISSEYDFSKTDGETIWTNAISRENIQRGNTKGMDFALRIAAAKTLPLFRGIFSKWIIETKIRKPDQIIPEQKMADTVVPGEYVKPHVEWVDGTKTIYQSRPKIGDISREVQYTHEVPISYENATFGDIQRGSQAFWSAKLGNYTGPHSPVTFSPDATQIQGFNLSFVDPANGQHIEWSTSLTKIKEYVNNHPNLNEFSTTHQDLSGIGDSVPITKLPDFMPADIKEAYLRYINGSSDKLHAFNEATQYSYGVPTTASQTMAQGWSAGDILENAVKTVTDTKTITTRGIVGYDPPVPVEIPWRYKTVIDGYYKAAQTIPGKVIPEHVVPGDFVNLEMDQAVTIGAMSGVGEVLSQILSPRYRRAQRATRNYHGKLDNGRVKASNRIGDNDMYDSPYESKDKAKRYEHHHSKDDRAMHSIDYDGKPMGDVRVYDDDDFVL